MSSRLDPKIKISLNVFTYKHFYLKCTFWTRKKIEYITLTNGTNFPKLCFEKIKGLQCFALVFTPLNFSAFCSYILELKWISDWYYCQIFSLLMSLQLEVYCSMLPSSGVTELYFQIFKCNYIHKTILI